MANLVQRLVGDLTPIEEVTLQQTKINIHAFTGALGELKRGKVTRADLITAFQLNAQQESQMDGLIARFQASTEKTEFVRVLKDLLYMGEAELVLGAGSPATSVYQDINFIQTRLEEEITDNGGIWP